MSKLHTHILISTDYYEELMNAAKKYHELQKEKHSATKKDEPNINVSEIQTEPMQKGFGDDDDFRTPALRENETSPTLHQQNMFRTPPVHEIPMAVDVDRGPEKKHTHPSTLVERFVEHIKPNWKVKSRHILMSLITHPDKVYWHENGDTFVDGKKIGNLHILLPKCFYGSRRIPSLGEETWFKLLARVGLDKFVTNKSVPRTSKVKKHASHSADRPWYKITMPK